MEDFDIEIIPKNKSLIGFVGGPITLYHFATRNHEKNNSLLNPFLIAMEKILTKNIDIQLETDLDLLMIFDTEANNLHDDDFKNKVIPFIKKQAQPKTKKDGASIEVLKK